MNFPDAFTLHYSPAAEVRVEPPDLVIVEGLAASLRFHRSRVLECRAMLVGYYREHFDASYVAPSDGEIVIRLRVEGLLVDLLGPFPHAEGIAIADAISAARGDLLFANPDFSVGIASDNAALTICCSIRG